VPVLIPVMLLDLEVFLIKTQTSIKETKMTKGLFILLALLNLSAVFAFDPNSAYRDQAVEYTVYEQRALRSANLDLASANRRRTPLSISKKFDPNTLSEATSWKSLEDMQKRFERMRDERFLVWRRNPEVLRRSSWLFPDDGCYARAALANRNLFRWFHPVPNKVFVFGNLRVKTPNSPRGSVGWWYHVAPIIEVDKEKYVLDPSIEFTRPLPLVEWLARMGTPEKMKLSICSSGTYAPSSQCDEETQGMELQAERAQQHYLDMEWSRLQRLGRQSEI
jgi:hypothetical protein